MVTINHLQVFRTFISQLPLLLVDA